MLVQLVVNGGTGVSITEVPTGWSVAANRVDNGTALMQIVYYRVATTSESIYTWKFTSNRAAGSLIVFRGVDTANPINAAGGQSNAPLPLPSRRHRSRPRWREPPWWVSSRLLTAIPASLRHALQLPCMTREVRAQTGAGPNGVAIETAMARGRQPVPPASGWQGAVRRRRNIGHLIALTAAGSQ